MLKNYGPEFVKFETDVETTKRGVGFSILKYLSSPSYLDLALVHGGSSGGLCRVYQLWL